MSTLKLGEGKWRVVPGPAKVTIRVLPESEEYRVPGSTKTLWIPRPNTHEGYLGTIHEEAQPYFDQNTGHAYEAIYKQGDIVLVGKFTGAPIELGRESFLVCRESDVVAKLVPVSATSEELPTVSVSSAVKHPLDS